MSVLKAKRHLSKAEFVNNADAIYVETIGFLLKLSPRYQQIFVKSTIEAATAVLDNAECAQNIKVTDETSYQLRKQHLLESRSWVRALDVHMSHIYKIIMMNPEGSIFSQSGKHKSRGEIMNTMDNLSQSLGEKIDKQWNLIGGVLQSDLERFNKLRNGESNLKKQVQHDEVRKNSKSNYQEDKNDLPLMYIKPKEDRSEQ